MSCVLYLLFFGEPKLGARNPIQVSHMSGRNSTSESSIAASAAAESAGSRNRKLESGLAWGMLIQNAGTLLARLNAYLSALKVSFP